MTEENTSVVDNGQALAALTALLLPMAVKDGIVKPYRRYRDATADNPAEMPAGPQIPAYKQAMEERIQEFEPEFSADRVKVLPPTQARELLPALTEHTSKAGNTRLNEHYRKRLNADNIVSINPYHDRASLAHELGHTVTQRTKLGNLIHKAKTEMRRPGTPFTLDGMRKIAAANEGKSIAEKAKAILRAPGGARQAAALATVLVPGMASVLTPGSDDTATALALAYAINAPTLLDEAFATGEGLGIMKRAGTPATLGQRGRLAGAYLTYLMAPTVAALSANAAGNFFDENV